MTEFSSFDPRPEWPHFSNFGSPADRTKTFFVEALLFFSRLTRGATQLRDEKSGYLSPQAPESVGPLGATDTLPKDAGSELVTRVLITVL